MVVPWFTLRQIIEEQTFEADKIRISPDAARLDKVLEAVWLQLSRNAESGTQIPGTDLHVIVTTAFPDAPALGVTYRFDEEHVYAMGLDLD